jgi:hypothetical protein
MNACQMRQRLLAQVSPLPAFPNFFTKASKDRSCGHITRFDPRTTYRLDITMLKWPNSDVRSLNTTVNQHYNVHSSTTDAVDVRAPDAILDAIP